MLGPFCGPVIRFPTLAAQAGPPLLAQAAPTHLSMTPHLPAFVAEGRHTAACVTGRGGAATAVTQGPPGWLGIPPNAILGLSPMELTCRQRCLVV